jgi:hypothetical protein
MGEILGNYTLDSPSDVPQGGQQRDRPDSSDGCGAAPLLRPRQAGFVAWPLVAAILLLVGIGVGVVVTFGVGPHYGLGISVVRFGARALEVPRLCELDFTVQRTCISREVTFHSESRFVGYSLPRIANNIAITNVTKNDQILAAFNELLKPRGGTNRRSYYLSRRDRAASAIPALPYASIQALGGG